MTEGFWAQAHWPATVPQQRDMNCGLSAAFPLGLAAPPEQALGFLSSGQEGKARSDLQLPWPASEPLLL